MFNTQDPDAWDTDTVDTLREVLHVMTGGSATEAGMREELARIAGDYAHMTPESVIVTWLNETLGEVQL